MPNPAQVIVRIPARNACGIALARRLGRSDGDHVIHILCRTAPRQVIGRAGQALKDRPERNRAADALRDLIADIAGFEIGEHQYIRGPGNV